MKNDRMNALYHCQYSILFHLVVATKYRRKCINKSILTELEKIFDRLCKKWQCQLLEFNGEEDHVHLLLSLTPKVAPSVFVNNLKSVSSRLIRRDYGEYLTQYYRKPVFWSRSYCMISCGGAPLSVLKQYIENQNLID